MIVIFPISCENLVKNNRLSIIIIKLKKIKVFVVGNPPAYFGGGYWFKTSSWNDRNIITLLRSQILNMNQ